MEKKGRCKHLGKQNWCIYRDVMTSNAKGMIFVMTMKKMNKGEAVLNSIRQAPVGSNVIIHNADMTVWCILKVIAKEHPEDNNPEAVIWPKKED
jgi:hypothetical protein